MDKSKVMQRLMATFIEELEEHVRHFNQDLLALEQKPPLTEQTERFKTLLRSAHSLKGAARSVTVPLIETACHHLEDILSGVRDGHTLLSAELFALLFGVVDAIEEAGMRLREQQDLAGAPLAALMPRLESAAAGKPNGAPPLEQSPPPLAPVGAEPRVPATAAAPGEAAARSFGPDIPGESSAGSSSVRVPAEKLDTLLARVGELQIAQRRAASRLTEVSLLQDLVAKWKSAWHGVEQFFANERHSPGNGGVTTMDHGIRPLPRRVSSALWQSGENLRRLDKAVDRLCTVMTGDTRLLEQVTQPLDDEVRRVRMLPFSDACAGLDRLVRDLAQTEDKEVDLLIEGGTVELDRSILEGLTDPLRHLVRNALDHGVELPVQRTQAGKPRRACIRVSAALRGAQVEVVVHDDGRGLDLEAIRTQARRRQLEAPAEEVELARLIFQPGFSTAPIVTDVSGRGVGLDVVKDRVESLHGTVDLASTPGLGARFTLNVPLTLTTLRAVLVVAGGRPYALSGTNVHKMARIGPADIRTVAGRKVLAFEDSLLPVASLPALLHGEAQAPQDKMLVVVVASGVLRAALIVDELLAEQEILIKSLGTRIRRVPFVAGATLLPSGKVALVLNAANLIRSVHEQSDVGSQHWMEQKVAPAPQRRRLLIVEDSVTTRTLMKSILEAAGFDVLTAVDGQMALELLQEQNVDVVVSDVDMPRMDGFTLTAALRALKRHQELPIVLVTARESEKDKLRGIEVGADAYLVKSAFDQRNLLATIRQML